METNVSGILRTLNAIQWRIVGQWSLLGLSVTCAAVTSIAWRLQHTDEQVEVKQVMTVLDDIYRRESTYLHNNMTYSPGFAQLGLDEPELADWSFSLVTARGGKRPLLLIEASNGNTRVAMDEQKAIFTSAPESMVAVSPWKPPVPPPSAAKTRPPRTAPATSMEPAESLPESPQSIPSTAG